jgi:hypothetical protein
MQLGSPRGKQCFEVGSLDQRVVGMHNNYKLEVVQAPMDDVKHTPTTALLVEKRPHFEPH